MVDEEDSAPDDPNEGTAPEPGHTDPVADGDDDGLPNNLDPDDDSDGVIDDKDDVDNSGNVPSAPVSNPSAPPVSDSYPAPEPVTVPYPAPEPVFAEAASPDNNAEHPVVLALPSTGSGTIPDRTPVLAILIGAGLLLATGGGTMLVRRR